MRPRLTQTQVGAALREQVARNVKRIRQESRLTQEQLAIAAGFHRSLVIRIERGHLNVTLETLAAVTQALGVPVEEVLAKKSSTLVGPQQRRRQRGRSPPPSTIFNQ